MSTTASSSVAGGEQQRAKRRRTPADRFTPEKHKPMTESAQYEQIIRNRESSKPSAAEREAEKKLRKAPGWHKVKGKGQHLDFDMSHRSGIWVPPRHRYLASSVEGKDFFSDPVEALAALERTIAESNALVGK
jgi:hypothetical protein